jgi:subtilase family serine protease
MNGRFRLALPVLTALTIAACNSSGISNIPHASSASSASARIGLPACAGSRARRAQCDVLLENAGPVERDVAGWTPANLQAAYNLPSSTNGSGQIVAIVDAYDNPNVASDLSTYRSNFGLGTPNFSKYNQNGQQYNYPRGSIGWGLEIDLDVAMVSASCPLCTIYLVEANSSNWSDLETAEKEAVALGATIVSNSYGGGGASQSDYDTPGITYVASAGDSGYSLIDPATFSSVFAAGGTVLHQSGSSYTETVWPGSGGGCSSFKIPKPSWQHDPKCTYRTGNDASAVASGVAEYDSYGYGGWVTVAGTSISSPLIASVFALAGNSTSQNGGQNIWSLNASQLASFLHPIASGSIVKCPKKLKKTYLCKAGTGEFGQYSGPSGWGTPNGIGAF